MIHPVGIRTALGIALLAAVTVLSTAAQKKEDVLLRFTGVLKTLTRNQIVIEPDPDNSMTFIRTRRTRIVDGGKETGSIKEGTPVSVDCLRRMNGELEAVTVTVIEVDQSPNK